MPVKLQGAQNQAFSGCGGKYFPAWAGNILPGPEQYPVVAPAGSALRVWLSQALDFWAQPARRPFNRERRAGLKIGLGAKGTIWHGYVWGSGPSMPTEFAGAEAVEN